MASSGRRSSPGSPNSTLSEEDPFPGPWKPLMCHFSAHHAVLFQFVKQQIVADDHVIIYRHLPTVAIVPFADELLN